MLFPCQSLSQVAGTFPLPILLLQAHEAAAALYGDNIEVLRHLWPPSALIVSGHQAGAIVKAGFGRGQRWAHGLFVLCEDQRQRDVLEMGEV